MAVERRLVSVRVLIVPDPQGVMAVSSNDILFSFHDVVRAALHWTSYPNLCGDPMSFSSKIADNILESATCGYIFLIPL